MGQNQEPRLPNHYAIYVLVEDYVKQGYHQTGAYSRYDGAQFTALLKRQRELPFGEKLQNHALNQRLNEEFRRFFPNSEYLPILRDVQTSRYWFNENLLKVTVGTDTVNIATAVLKAIDAYVDARKAAFEKFIADLEKIKALRIDIAIQARSFVQSLLQPNVDARLFEIVSYAILKEYYSGQTIYWGWEPESIHEEALALYKTGRTNANDGGIDFVMKPLGRFFQVTETTDVKKYFLDIDKIQKYPLTFVVKSNDSVETLLTRIEQQARRVYQVDRIVERYMNCIEEVINISILLERLEIIVQANRLSKVIEEMVIHSKVEFGQS